MPAEIILGPIIEAVFGYALDQSKLGDKMRHKLGLDPAKRAFERALDYALKELHYKHPEHTAHVPDSDFFERQGAPILAQFLSRAGSPDPAALAERWAAWLDVSQAGRSAPQASELQTAAADFLADLARALKDEPALSDLYDSRALEQLVQKLDAAPATPATRRAYLHWLIERNLYLDPRGAFQTQRQVQVKLDEVYISLRAQREQAPGAADRRLLEREMAELEALVTSSDLPAEEMEDRREALLARYAGRRRERGDGPPGEIIELAQAVQRHERLVILGDPGSGKTTLLRYLALKHAQGLESGSLDKLGMIIGDLGPARFPILIRIADYAENDVWKEQALSDFLARHCARHECPRAGLDDLLRQELAGGNCLVLLDGLDEIVHADDRRGIVGRIEDFVRRYDDRPNRFVITSRIAGYRSAPLGAPFACYTVQEMDQAQIRRFLERWCTAVEAAQTPELSAQARWATAHREIQGIMQAVENAPGVRRLAANPLMLRILALIHRTGAQLPQKRVELYKLAADTLARTWRTAQGVPESALVDERYLTRLLSHVAYWLHRHKPSGIATQREIYDVLGQEWARIHRLPWEEDDPHIQKEVGEFLRAVREHTGLFVERAPRRYGFMHLTFEEYYAARYLVARRRQAAQLIRQRLHDPRWDEPILLALGFVGLDYPEEATELLETAILAEGEDAEELGLAPSPYEELLGRDFMFALRCLGDRIPADRRLVRRLSQRLSNEILHQTGSAHFQRYREALDEKLAYLKGSDAEDELVPLLVAALGNYNSDVYSRAAVSLSQLGQTPPQVEAALIAALGNERSRVRFWAAEILGELDKASPQVADALIAALSDDDSDVRDRAAGSLVQLSQASPQVTDALIAALSNDKVHVRSWAAGSLGQLGQGSPQIVEALLAALGDVSPNVRSRAARSLGQLGQASPQVVDALLAALGDDDWPVRSSAAGSLGQLGQASPQVVDTLLTALDDDDANVRYRAAWSLGQLGQASPQVAEILTEVLQKVDDWTRRYDAARLLGQVVTVDESLVLALWSGLLDEDGDVRAACAEALSNLGRRFPAASDAIAAKLVQAIRDPEFAGHDYAFDGLWLLMAGERGDGE
jgi:HEAT repeat protein/energy-coupling factor transporter ATP-binding protein EcfA2